MGEDSSMCVSVHLVSHEALRLPLRLYSLEVHVSYALSLFLNSHSNFKGLSQKLHELGRQKSLSQTKLIVTHSTHGPVAS